MTIRRYDFNVETESDVVPAATDALQLPTGTTAERPTGAAGLIRHNTTTQQFEGHNGTDWGDIGGGSGAGSRNYLDDWFDGARSVGTVTNSITATGNITPGSTWKASNTSLLTIANVTSGGLRSGYSLKLDHVAVGAAFVQTPEFTLDTVDLGKPVTVKFDHGAVTAADDYQVYMVRYNSSGVYQEQISIAGTASATSPYSARIAAGSVGSFQGFFIANSTSTDLYALRFYRNNAADTTDVMIDSLYVGPQSVVQGAAVTDWVSFTPSISTATLSLDVSVGWYRRVGDSMEITVNMNSSGSGSGGSIVVAVPGGYTADTSKYSSASATGTLFGAGQWYDHSGTDMIPLTVNLSGPISITLQSQNAGNWDMLDGADIAVTDSISFFCTIPIVGWSSNVTMANRAVEEYYSNTNAGVTANTTYSAATSSYALNGTPVLSIASTSAAQTTNYDITLLSPPQQNDSWKVEFNNGFGQWIDAPPFIQQGTSYYGVYAELTSATNLRVYWGNMGVRPSNTTYAGAGNAWSNLSGYRWRVRKVSGGASVGYPVSARNVVGDTSGTAVPSGFIGEKQSLASAGAAAWTTNQYMDGGNAGLTLQPGIWLIKSQHIYAVSSDSAVTQLTFGVGTASGNSATGLTEYTTLRPASHTPAGNQRLVSPSVYVNISAATTYYPKFLITGTRSGGTVASDLEAIRIA